MLAGLAAPARAIPARWLYDRRGSELFEAITLLKEYYPTRTERAILAARAAEIGAAAGSGRVVVEFGSGSSVKTPQVLSAVEASRYVPIDISGEFLRESVCSLAKIFPHLPMHPIEGDFTAPLTLPCNGGAPVLGFFPGSTIGNLVPEAAINLLRVMRKTLGAEALFLIGLDRIKPVDILLPAYDDSQRVTAQFNLNLLYRINRELEGDIPVAEFRHVARWNEAHARIEMHLEAARDVSFQVAGRSFAMARGETIHTENSYKYGERDTRLLLRAGGWSPLHVWTDEAQLFSVVLARACTPPPAP